MTCTPIVKIARTNFVQHSIMHWCHSPPSVTRLPRASVDGRERGKVTIEYNQKKRTCEIRCHSLLPKCAALKCANVAGSQPRQSLNKLHLDSSSQPPASYQSLSLQPSSPHHHSPLSLPQSARLSCCLSTLRLGSARPVSPLQTQHRHS